MKSGVYMIRCKADGRIYVGASKRLARRFSDHRRALNRGEHWIDDLQTAWISLGEAEFEFVILERCQDTSMLVSLEQNYLDDLQPFGDRGFNTIKKANAARRDKPLPPAEAARWGQAFKGHKHTVEAKERIRQARIAENWQRGRPWSAEQRANTLAKRKRGEQHHYHGKHRDEAVCRAISDKLSKPVAQITLDGALVRTWRNAKEAAESVGLKSGSRIYDVCNGKAPKAAGYTWAYIQRVEMAA